MSCHDMLWKASTGLLLKVAEKTFLRTEDTRHSAAERKLSKDPEALVWRKFEYNKHLNRTPVVT